MLTLTIIRAHGEVFEPDESWLGLLRSIAAEPRVDVLAQLYRWALTTSRLKLHLITATGEEAS